jgi:penicillin-binding protein 1A
MLLLGRVWNVRWFSKRGEKTHPIGSLFGWLFAGLPVLCVVGLAAGTIGGCLGAYVRFSDNLPRVPDLRNYKPKTVSTFFAEDGTVIGVFYKEKRFPVPLGSLPKHVVEAFLAAEDARFFSHTGVDVLGVARAFLKNLKSGYFSQGGSTITQQVTKNFVLSREKRLSRKIKEAILSFRLEKTLSKEEILEIYLNEIYLGRGCYGVESAARTYFDKNASDLTVAEAAMLAGFVSNPSKFSNPRNLDASLKRREYVLENMVRYGFLSGTDYRTAVNEAPQFCEPHSTPYDRVPYFTEAVRQHIIQKYGEDRLYNEGLQVWTTCDIPLQDKASESLAQGIQAWEKRQNRPAGLIRSLKASEAKEFLKIPRKAPYRVGDVVRAMVVETHPAPKQKGKRTDTSFRDCTLSLPGNVQVRMAIRSVVPYRQRQLLEFRVVDVRDGLPVLEHQSVPPIQGAVVCVENKTGYVRALVGGLDFERSSFNRAVQAYRQPGSAFKPLVYAAALEWGDYSPNTLIVDEPIAVLTDPRRGEWIPSNADAQYRGLMTIGDALAQSRNVAAVKVLMDVGVEPAIRMARRMGIRSRLEKNLSLCLGTSEVTPLNLTAAYTIFPNMGVRVEPVLIKKVLDRFGNVLEENTVPDVELGLRAVQAASPDSGVLPGDDLSQATDPDTGSGNPQPPLTGSGYRHAGEGPSPLHPGVESLLSGPPARPATAVRSRPQRVLSPSTAYLMVSMMHKACVNGTAASVSRLKRHDLAGKTGTTDDSSDAWFVGFNPTYTTGVWVGYDTKVSLGRQEHGATAALPVWMDFMKAALANDLCVGYEPPEGIAFADQTWGAARRDLGSLLASAPDRIFSFDTKPVCPVDSAFILASAGTNPLTVMPAMAWADNRGLRYPSVRILSRTGQDLGVGYYMPDEKGVMTLHRDWAAGTVPRPGSETVGEFARISPPAPQSPGPQGIAQYMADYLRQLGWHQ